MTITRYLRNCTIVTSIYLKNWNQWVNNLKDVLLGIDVGTTGIKVAVYTTQGQCIDRAYSEYTLTYSNDSWVEMDPEIWWEELCTCLTEIYDKGNVSPKDIIGVGITCTNALILLDSDKRLLMPAIMQLDQRGNKQAENIKIQLGHDIVFSKTGNRVASGAFWGPTLQWIRDYDPSLYAKAMYFLNPTSYLILRMTGAYCIDHCRATSTMLYNIHKKDWDHDLCQFFSIEPNKLPPIYKPYQVVGYINNEGQTATDLSKDTPVVAGGMDTIGALIGLGAGSDKGALIMGSVGRFCIESDYVDDRFMNTVNVEANQFLTMTPVNSTGVSYKWIKNVLFTDQENISNIYQVMDELAEEVSMGSDGLLYLPYLMGERSPLWDSLAKGSFMGLNITHQQKHFVRSVLEGVAFALTHNYYILKEELDINPDAILAGGGGARSNIWMQVISSMIDKTLLITKEPESETLGAAILAALGTGVYTEIKTAQDKWVTLSKSFEPDPVAHRFYHQILPIFKELYHVNRNYLTQLDQIQRNSSKYI